MSETWSEKEPWFPTLPSTAHSTLHSICFLKLCLAPLTQHSLPPPSLSEHRITRCFIHEIEATRQELPQLSATKRRNLQTSGPILSALPNLILYGTTDACFSGKANPLMLWIPFSSAPTPRNLLLNYSYFLLYIQPPPSNRQFP